MPSPRVAEVSLLQFMNTPLPMEVTLPGTVTDASDGQMLNAFAPIEVIVDGSSSVLRPAPRNASSGIAVRPEGKLIVVSAVQ